jgi:uncharacterized protein involved in outer membrane biogenesis
MKFLQQPIERKLSSLLGAAVTFRGLKISPLAGKLEAEGMTVAGDTSDKPLLYVRRIIAEISRAKALAGKLVVKSLVIEGPEIFLVRQSDGSLNIPARAPKPPANEDAEDESEGWQFEAQSIRVEDGRIRFQQDSQIASVDEVSGELKLIDGQIEMAAIALQGTVGVNDWISAHFPAGAAFMQSGPVEARIRVDITLPLDVIFPRRKA